MTSSDVVSLSCQLVRGTGPVADLTGAIRIVNDWEYHLYELTDRSIWLSVEAGRSPYNAVDVMPFRNCASE